VQTPVQTSDLASVGNGLSDKARWSRNPLRSAGR